MSFTTASLGKWTSTENRRVPIFLTETEAPKINGHHWTWLLNSLILPHALFPFVQCMTARYFSFTTASGLLRAGTPIRTKHPHGRCFVLFDQGRRYEMDSLGASFVRSSFFNNKASSKMGN